MKLATFSIAVAPHLAAGLLLAAYGAPVDEIARAPKAELRIVTVTPPPLRVVAPPERPRPPKPARTLMMHLEHGELVPEGRPNTWIHVPATRDIATDLRLTFVFHGFKNCIESYTSGGIQCSAKNNVKRPGYQIATQLERAGSRSIVVVPETSFDVPSAEAPELSRHGAFRAYVEEVLEALSDETGGAHVGDVHRLALVASSGGYQALEPILEDAGSLVTDVLLLDAGYMYPNSAVGRFLNVAATEIASGTPAHRAGILYTPSGGALATSEELLRVTMHHLDAVSALDRGRFKHFKGDPELDDLTPPLYVHRVDEDHDVVVRRNLGRVIAAAGL